MQGLNGLLPGSGDLSMGCETPSSGGRSTRRNSLRGEELTGSFASAGKEQYTSPSQIHVRVPAFPYETGRAGTISR